MRRNLLECPDIIHDANVRLMYAHVLVNRVAWPAGYASAPGSIFDTPPPGGAINLADKVRFTRDLARWAIRSRVIGGIRRWAEHIGTAGLCRHLRYGAKVAPLGGATALNGEGCRRHRSRVRLLRPCRSPRHLT